MLVTATLFLWKFNKKIRFDETFLTVIETAKIKVYMTVLLIARRFMNVFDFRCIIRKNTSGSII